MADFVSSLGTGFLAHRLRRASDDIVAASTLVLRRHGFAGPARSVSTLILLRDQGAMGVTEIAQRLRLSHPMVIKLTRALADEGLVTDATDPRDSRRRIIAITEPGRRQAGLGERAAHAVADALGPTGGELLRLLELFTAELRKHSLEERIEAALTALVE